MIDAETIIAAQKHLSRRCPTLRKFMRQYGPCTLGQRKRDPFHVLASSIIGQQLSTKAGDTIQARVHTLTGVRTRLTPEKLLSKCKWLIGISESVLSGELNFKALRKMDDELAVEALDALPGVGRWTAEMFLIFAMDRLDIFSMGDVGLRNGVNRLFNEGRKLEGALSLGGKLVSVAADRC